MENSTAYELLKALKLSLKIMSVIAVAELVIIGYMGYLLYDSQFDYTSEETQNVENTIVESSSIIQY